MLENKNTFNTTNEDNESVKPSITFTQSMCHVSKHDTDGKNPKHDKARKWQLTFNNPIEHGFTHDVIKDILATYNCDYYCMCDEIGLEEQTPHTHLFLFRQTNIRFDKLKKDFPSAHIEYVYGSCQENKDYIRKEGKWINDEKTKTNLKDTFEEFGTFPKETTDKKKKDKELLVNLVLDGWTTREIILEYPQFVYQKKNIDSLRETLYFSQFKENNRDVKVYYLYGETGTGKSHFVRSLFNPRDIYVISEYKHPFDSYEGQKCIVFEEFRADLDYKVMLQLLDIYPIDLPARYENKTACYDYVFIISNLPPQKQYYFGRDENSEDALYRRINNVIEFEKDWDNNTSQWIRHQTSYDGVYCFEKGIEGILPNFDNIYESESE